MKTLRIFSMAALVLVMAACTSSDIEIPQQDGKIHFTAKIAAPNSGSATKTVYTEGESTINVAWRAKVDGVYEGDKIALIHNGVKDIATVTAVDESGNATIEATISGTPQDGDDVVLVYPAASVDATGSGTAFEPNDDYLALGFNQDGTLNYIQDKLDGRQGSGKLSVSGGTASLKGSVKMDSKIAIWKLNLTSDGTTAINAKTVTLNLGNQAIAGGADDSGKSEYYICVVPATLAAIYAAATAASLPTPAFTIEANDGTDTYTYTKDSPLTLANNGYYQSTVTMAKTVNIADGAVTVPAGEHWLVVGDGTAVGNTITIEDGATVTLRNVNILASGNAINCEGDAEIVLTGTNTIYSQVSNSGDNNKAIIKAGPVDKTLTISGNGTLEVRTRYTGTWMGAFIGSDKNSVCGNITITGGTITAIAYPKPGATEYNNSASNGAVIGAGCANDGTSSCGNILITGGTVTVDTHAGGGAGIGSGTSESSSGISTCGTITISGGSVNSKANLGGAGIGSGRVGIVRNNVTYNGYSRCEGIIIEGTASVTASSSSGSAQNDYAGAAIGTGNSGQVGYITIRGGTVTATANYHAPGIGAGRFKSNCGDISISGGTVTAQGGYEAAGIGTGNGYQLRVSTCGKITITADVTKVTAYKGANGYKSIGQGKAAYTSCSTVTIGESTGQQADSPYIYPAP